MRSRVRPLPIHVGRDACGNESLEWLVTNGIGGYASGTVAGLRTRRYHGLLVAALAPPAGRTVMVTDVHERICIAGHEYALGTARWSDQTISPRGFEHIETFRLDGRTPTWRFAIGDHLIEKRVYMLPGQNTTALVYTIVRGQGPVHLDLVVLAGYRDHHATTRAGGWRMQVEARSHEASNREARNNTVCVTAFDGARPLRVIGRGMNLEPAHTWYEGFDLARERERGLDDRDDALCVATATADLSPGADVVLAFSAESEDIDLARVRGVVEAREKEIVQCYRTQQGPLADSVGARLALSADQFIVGRTVAGEPGTSVIAGYPWFADWGRDTMIGLPGLTLETGRPEVARQLLLTYARFVDGGMLPNRFPDHGDVPEYNTVDATLWFVEAARVYVEMTGDSAIVRELWPVLQQIVDHHDRGTRHGIVVDARDGLVTAGESGVQLTWMDAKVGDWVVTPRRGKCVEINALWYSALQTLAGFAVLVGEPDGPWRERAALVRESFTRFWRDDLAYLCDVIDGPDGDDTSFRPNQIFAVSLPASPLDPARWKDVVDACAARLVTSHGLRSLASTDEHYRPAYGGDRVARDSAYHQGTVWAWSLGAFALAHHRVYGDAGQARTFLEPLIDHLSAYGVGSIAEIFDGDPPHRPRGCPAQAWSVAETIRAWATLCRLERQH